jgi:hypothetical protein
MAINLKEILISDVDNIKLDKVNYNFDQLVANGGGPQGYQGETGDTGYQGITGYQGTQGIEGDQGFQGDQGQNGQNIWKINSGNSANADTILPIHNPLDSSDAPSVIIGYKTTDPEYLDSYIESDSQFVINRHTNFNNNLELKTSGFETAFAFKLDQVVNSTDAFMQMYFVGGTGSINQYADTFTWRLPTSTDNLIKLNATQLDINVDTVFTKNVEIKGNLKIGTGSPGIDKIAISADALGTIEFKNIEDIGGTVPVGTIISMLPAYFEDNNKFVSTHSVTPIDDEPINIYVGRGIGEYAGWYICNGHLWTNGTDSFLTPDLNSFSYNIDDNPNSQDLAGQGSAIVTNDEIPVIGGADTQLTATYNNGTSLFDVTGTVESSADLLQSNQTGSVFVIKRLPQIIYLGKEDLTWSDAGDNQAPTTTVFYNFVDQSDVAPIVQTVTYNVTNMSGNSGTFNVGISAPQGQYWDSNNIPVINTPANYSINSTTVSGTAGSPEYLNIQVGYSSHPNTSGNVTFTYNSNGSIVVTPIEEEINFEFYDTFTDPNNSTLDIPVTDTNGTDGSVIGEIQAPAGQYWTGMPTITSPTGFAITNPSLQITNGSNYANVYRFTVTYESFPYDGPINFTYSRYMQTATIPEVEMLYEVLGGVARNGVNRNQAITAGLGSTVTLSEVTLKAAVGKYWRVGADTVMGSAATYNNGSVILRNGDFTIISSELDYAAGDAFGQPSLLKLIIQDSDFGNETETPGGIDGTVKTSININHPYDEISRGILYIESSLSQASWDTGNKSSASGAAGLWSLKNESTVQQYVKIYVSSSLATTATGSLTYDTQEQTGDLSASTSSGGNIANFSTTYNFSSSYITLAPGSMATIDWTTVYSSGSEFGIYLVSTSNINNINSLNRNNWDYIIK